MIKKDSKRELRFTSRHAAQADAVEPRAKSAEYDRNTGRILVELRSGESVTFQPELLQGLAGASSEALSNIEILPSGAGLYWPDIDEGFTVPGLMTGMFGNRAWMEKIGHPLPEYPYSCGG